MKLGNVILGVVGRNGAADHLSGSRAHVRRVEDVNAIHYPLAEEGVPGHVAGYWSMFGISFSKPSGLIAGGQEVMALAKEQLATATADAQKLRACVACKRVRG